MHLPKSVVFLERLEVRHELALGNCRDSISGEAVFFNVGHWIRSTGYRELARALIELILALMSSITTHKNVLLTSALLRYSRRVTRLFLFLP